MTSFRRIVCLATAVAGVSFSASAKTCTWINADASAAQDWTVAENWQDGQVPGAGDDVAIGCAANINFAGATIGNLVHTAGALELRAARGTPLTLMGDFVTTGASVNTWAEIYLPEGEHMISNTCDIVLRENQRIYGEGGIVKRGPKNVTFTGWERNLSVDISGSLKIYSGGFTQGYYTKLPNVTEILVDGSAARLNFNYQGGDYMNQNVAVMIRNGAKASFGQGYTHHVMTLSIEDKDCVAGNWYPVNTGALKWHMDVSLTGNTAGCLAVAEGPAEGGWAGIDPEHPWSGRVATWIGGGKTTGKNDPTNWKDGIIVGALDDLVIEGAGAPASFDTMSFRHVTVKADWGLNATITILGDVHLDGGSMSGGWTYYKFLKGDHVIDGTGDVSFANQSCFQGEGNITWRSTGAIRWPQYNNGGGNTFTGSFRMEAGTIVQDCGCCNGGVPFGGTTNVVFTGEGVVAKFIQSPFNTNAWVTVEKGAKLLMTVASTNVIRHLMMDEHEGRAGRTYGSSTSEARHQDDVHFVGTGVFRPWEDLSGKDPLVDDVGIEILPIGKQYTDFVHPCEPVPVVMDTRDGTAISPGPYEVSYSDNIQAGTATVRVLGTEGIYEDANAVQTFVVEKDPRLRETSTWTNTNASVAQVWTDPANWKDGKVPSAGDNVIIEGGAYIDFSGAELGSIQHSSGTLTIDTPTAAMTLNGDLVFSGTKVTMKPTTKITFPDGVHVISNSCAIAFPFCGDPRTDGVTFNGAGSIVKKGKGSMGVESWAYWYVNTTGSFEILGGTVTTSYRSNCPLKCSEFLVSGVNSQLTAAYLNGNGFAAGAVLRLEDGGLVHFSDSDAGNVRLGAVYLDGQQLVAGTWKSWNGTAAADYRWVDFLGASNLKITIATGPAEGGFTGLAEGAMWSGRTRYYIANNGYSSTSSWKDGIPARPLDDVIVQVATTWSNQKHDLNPIHDLTCEKSLTLSEATFTLAGDIHLQNGSGLSLSWEPKAFTLTAGEHVIDGTGDLTLSSWKYMNGAGSLIWRSTGTIKNNDPASNKISITGNLSVEAGTITIPNADYLPNVTNVAVSGEGTLLKLDAAALNANARVTVEKGAKLRLNGTFTNDVKRLVLGGNDRMPRIYGGANSPAVWKPKYFTSNAGDKGVLNVTEGFVPGCLLIVR